MSTRRKLIVSNRRIRQIARAEIQQLRTPKESVRNVEDNILHTENYHNQPNNCATNFNYEDSVDSNVIYSSSSGDESEAENFNLLIGLKEWAISNNINHAQFSELLKVLRKHSCHHDFPSDSRSVIKANKSTVSVFPVNPGKYCHLEFSSKIKSLYNTTKTSPLYLQIGIDGLPIYKSSNIQFWPILGFLVGISKEPFAIGIYSGNKKPESVNEFLNAFVDEFIKLKNDLLLENKHLFLHSVICDAPAKSYVKGIKGHTGYFGCDKCEVEGEHKNYRMTFTDTAARKRTNQTFRSRQNEDHHLRDSILERVESLDMIKCFPCDYMHLICLGVIRKFIQLITKGKPSPHKLSNHNILQLSSRLVSLAPYVVSEFQRKPRTLLELDRWKAVEFRQLLLYSGIIVLKDLISPDCFIIFKVLLVATSILSSEKLHKEQNKYANDLLIYFVQSFIRLFGNDVATYNVHCLIHLAEDVNYLGPLDSFSAFKFENKLGKIKKLIRTPNKPLEQVINRLCEVESQSFDIQSDRLPTVKWMHFVGPVPPNFRGQQYRCIIFPNFTIKIGSSLQNFQKDSFCLTDKKSLLKVTNVLKDCSGEYLFFGDLYTTKHPLFTEPCDSSLIDIYQFQRNSFSSVVLPVSAIQVKCQVYPEQDTFCVVPLLHCS